jgi:hypothetical protein
MLPVGIFQYTYIGSIRVMYTSHHQITNGDSRIPFDAKVFNIDGLELRETGYRQQKANKKESKRCVRISPRQHPSHHQPPPLLV